MLCPPPLTLNPVTIFEAARLPHRANPSRAAGSFIGYCRSLTIPESIQPHSNLLHSTPPHFHSIVLVGCRLGRKLRG
jgi:hypothetical protein